MLTDLAAITAIITYAIDCTDIIGTVKRWIGIWLNIEVGSMKPIDCSLCMTHWCGLLYIILTGQFSLVHWAVVCAFSLLALPLGQLINTTIDLLSALVARVSKINQRLW